MLILCIFKIKLSENIMDKLINMIILILFIALLNTSFASDPVIKSLQFYSNKNVTKLPVLRMNSNDKLTITFDVEAESEPSFNIKFMFCDANWKPYDNLLLQGIGENTHYGVYAERLPITTEGAEYFVKERYPNRDIKFNNSGKWMFFVTDPFDEDIVYEWGKFYVVEKLINLKSSIQNWRREGGISSNNAVDRVLNLKTKFTLPDSIETFRVEHIEIVKNLEMNNPIILKKDAFAKNRGYEWDGANNYEFVIRDLEPGNEYRQVNLKDRNKYEYPKTRAHFDGIEYSKFYKLGKKDFNGGFRLMDKKNEYADYLVAKFEFRPHENIYDDIFIVGSFTNWEVLPWFKLNEKDDLYSISLELKRGIYDYQYVRGNIEDEEVENINWRIFEGNYWDTENVYSIFLYYKSPEKGEYDKIIGYKQIVR
jgi:Type 9 secretion system plug protein 1st domain